MVRQLLQLQLLQAVQQCMLTYNGQLITQRGQLYKMEMLSRLVQQKPTLFQVLKVMERQFIGNIELVLVVIPRLDLPPQRYLELLVVQQ